jgi:hypothetical protein
VRKHRLRFESMSAIRVSPQFLTNGVEKTRKGMRGVGWEAYVTSRDPILAAVGTRSCAIRRGMSKKCATEIFGLSLRVGPSPMNLGKEFPQKIAKDTKTDGARETREKTRKGMRGVGWGGPCHIARSDIGRGRDALLRDPALHVIETRSHNPRRRV